jgi:poly(beta-D-mannuronate) lyase
MLALMPCIAGAAAPAPPVSPATIAALSAPFAIRSSAQVSAGKRSQKNCAAPVAPVIALAITSKYGDDGPQRDTVDAAAEAEEQAQMAPLRSYTGAVVKMANAYTRDGDPTMAACALSWLAAWADANALSDMRDQNAQFQRAGAMAGLSLALLQISGAVADDPRYASVAQWMRRQSAATIRNFNATTHLKGSRNNHVYWAALAAASVAVVNNDRAMLEWAAQVYNKGVCGATAEGGLPLELARGGKARDYQLFALSALVPLALILKDNGIDAFATCDGALHRIVAFGLQAVSSPQALTALAGKAQHPHKTGNSGLPPKNQVAFIEAYHRDFPGKAPLEARLLALRPLLSTDLGGDQTLLYGGKAE